MNPVQIGRPEADRCFGREECCEALIKAALQSGTVLLFGCRRAGKTTILLRTRDKLEHRCLSDAAGPLLIPVYLDLLKISPDADASEVFRLFINAAEEACSRIANKSHVVSSSMQNTTGVVTVDELTARLSVLVKALMRSDASFVFLLDEAKRILGQRFSRGFQDNLFALVYGEHEVGGRISIAFSGSQELYKFSLDETSPIGSRAATVLVGNLDVTAVASLVQQVEAVPATAVDEFAARVHDLTGGQAGLSLRVLVHPEDLESDNEESVLLTLRTRQTRLFQIWNAALSKEAACVQATLVEQGSLRYKEITRRLIDFGFDRYRRDRVIEELVFSGLAARGSTGIEVLNRVYASFVLEHLDRDQPTGQERDAWIKIEEVEILLRQIVRHAYRTRWDAHADQRMSEALGPDSWGKVQSNKTKAAHSYRYTSHVPDSDVLHYVYFGQLAQLMLARNAWDLFSKKFRDKRELEDIVKDVTPVRNDSAHFRSVPEREILRCTLRCDDLIHLLQVRH